MGNPPSGGAARCRRPLIILLASLFLALLSACHRPASTSAPGSPSTAILRVEQVEVIQAGAGAGAAASGIRASGSARISGDDCLYTALLVEGERVDWWPEDVCVQPDDHGRWEMVVALGRNSAPPALDPNLRYTFQAWARSSEAQTRTALDFTVEPR